MKRSAKVDGIFPKKKDMVGCVEIPAITTTTPITEVTMSATPLTIPAVNIVLAAVERGKVFVL